MNYQTNEQLSELRLNAMKMEYQRQAELPAISELTFDERFSMIVTAQINARRDAKMKRLIRAADLREPGASLSSCLLQNINAESCRAKMVLPH